MPKNVIVTVFATPKGYGLEAIFVLEYGIIRVPPLFSSAVYFFQNHKFFDNGTELRDAANRYVSNDPTVVDVYGAVIANWCVDRVTTFDGVFNSLDFNEPLTNWNTSSATSMYGMFAYAKTFNQPIEQFQVSRVVDFVRRDELSLSVRPRLNCSAQGTSLSLLWRYK